MSALALTDHLGLWGAAAFYREARAAGIKPVIGCEVRVRGVSGAGGERVFHLVLLARNREGYENLVALVSRSFSRAQTGTRRSRAAGARRAAEADAGAGEGGAPIPVLEPAELEARRGGLIALSPALEGEVGRLLLEGDEPGAMEAAAAFRDILGPDGFFLEVAWHRRREEAAANGRAAALARQSGLGLVGGNDVHFPRREDAALWALVRAAGRRRQPRPYSAPCRLPMGEEYWLKPPAEMAALLAEYPEAVANTLAVAQACRLELPLGELHLPEFPLPPGLTADAFLARLAREGLERRLGRVDRLYGERLEAELAVISGRRLASYFLLLWDLCRYAGDRGITVGPGRGSAAGSLVAFALGITGVDPVRHGLLFERFLSRDRPGLPDIDLDVDHLGRNELIAWLFRRHGDGRAFRVGSVARHGPRGAVRAAAGALGIPEGTADRLARLLPERGGPGLMAILAEWPEFRGLPLRERPWNDLIAAAAHLEGVPHHLTAHPAGVVVGDAALARLVPVQLSPAGEPVSQYDMADLEALGALKLDILGLRTLTVVGDAVSAAGQGVLPGLEREGIPSEDREAWRLLRRGETVGCFQLESPGMRRLLRAYRPRDVDDLAALLALYRPGPWDAGAVHALLRRRRGGEPPSYPHPLLEPILRETYGVILYQEQVMQIASALAGMSLAEADALRRALERRGDDIEALGRRFVAQAAARGVDPSAAEAVLALLVRFSGYSFCKAHSVPYALVSYWTAFLKARCPAHYFAALLTIRTGYYAPWVYVEEARRLGVPVLPPDVNLSTAGFHAAPAGADGWGIRPGLLAAKGVGYHLARRILEARLRGGPFRSVADLSARVGRALTPRALRGLVAAGYCDSLGERQDVPRGRRMAWEEETLGWAWSGGLRDLLAPLSAQVGATGSGRLATLPGGSRVTVAGRVVTCRRMRARSGGPLLFLVLHDGEGMVEAMVPSERYVRLFREIDPAGVVVRGRLAGGRADRTVIAEEIRPLAEEVAGARRQG